MLFINRAPDLMNVAVSRAKDSFLVLEIKESALQEKLRQDC